MINKGITLRFMLISICLLLISTLSYSQQISQQQARQIAEKYMKHLTTSPTLRAFGTTPPFYAFNKKGGGFIIVSADERLTDVVGYSDKGEFNPERLPSELKYYLTKYSEYVGLVRANKVKEYKVSVSPFKETVKPLLKSEWGQNYPFNLLTPTFTNHYNNIVHAPTGCVATSVSQIMYYHKWPAKGVGSRSYHLDSKNETLSVDFSKSTYQWDNIHNTYSRSYKASSSEAVAKLMYDVGVSVEMDYNQSVSGAYSEYASRALSENFSYLSKIMYRSNYSTRQFTDSIKSYLNKDIPIIYNGASKNAEITGSAHSWVVDGYDNNGFLHCNWGWDGVSNGYFNMNYMNPPVIGTGGGTGGFLNYQSIIIAIPKRGDYANVSTINDYTLSIGGRLRYKTDNKDGVQRDSIIIDELKSNSEVYIPFVLGLKVYNGSVNEVIKFNVSFNAIDIRSEYVNLTLSITNILSSLDDGDYKAVLMYDNQRGNGWQEVGNQAPISISKKNNSYTVSPSPIDITEYQSPVITPNISVDDISNITLFLNNKSAFDVNSDIYLKLIYQGSDNNEVEPIVLKVNEDVNIYDNTKVEFECPFRLQSDIVKKYGRYKVEVKIQSRRNDADSVVIKNFQGQPTYVNVLNNSSQKGDIFLLGLDVQDDSQNSITNNGKAYISADTPFVLQVKLQNNTTLDYNNAIGLEYEDMDTHKLIHSNAKFMVKIPSNNKSPIVLRLKNEWLPSNLLAGKSYNIRVALYDGSGTQNSMHILPIKDYGQSDNTTIVVTPCIKKNGLRFSNLSLYTDNKKVEDDIILYDEEIVPSVSLDVDISNDDIIGYQEEVSLMLRQEGESIPSQNLEIARLSPLIDARSNTNIRNTKIDLVSIEKSLTQNRNYILVFAYHYYDNGKSKIMYTEVADAPKIVLKERENKTAIDEVDNTSIFKVLGSIVYIKQNTDIRSVDVYSISGELLKSIFLQATNTATINLDTIASKGQVLIIVVNKSKAYKVLYH